MKQNHNFGPALALLSLAALMAAPAAVSAQTITNGTFDTDASGWTATNVDAAGGYSSTGGDPGGYFILNSNGNAATDPTLSQTITGLVIGQTYTITGDFKPQYLNSNSPTGFGAAIDGVFGYEGDNSSFTTWKPFAFDFVASATSATLSLSAERNGSDDDYGIDNIAITPASVPEASTTVSLAVLLGLGGLTLGLRARRRSHT